MNEKETKLVDEIDSEMHHIFLSWFESHLDEDLLEEQRQIAYLHLRMAFISGRMQGHADFWPILAEHVAKIQALTKNGQ